LPGSGNTYTGDNESHAVGLDPAAVEASRIYRGYREPEHVEAGVSQDLERLAGPATLGSGPTPVITVPAGREWVVQYMALLNLSGVTVTVSVGVNGVTNDDLIWPPTPLGANERATFEGELVLNAGDVLYVNASGSGITFSADGIDEEP